MTTSSHRFFRNTQCRYFPCHSEPEPESFNCMFCFCPLYSMGDKCGGDFVFSEKGMKNCKDCHLPHQAEYYDVIIEELKNQT
ncbi:MAG: cysteine-rich small domain-containing protein [Coriobacteriia bacterium]|nr:cysteine-rich small domain-containing protein [Coriobacteriia bacterium]